jgi:hypothetical protein
MIPLATNLIDFGCLYLKGNSLRDLRILVFSSNKWSPGGKNTKYVMDFNSPRHFWI